MERDLDAAQSHADRLGEQSVQPSERYPPARTRFSFQSLLRRWQAVLLHPSVATFDAQQPFANWRTILVSLLIQGVVAAITGFIHGLEPHAAIPNSMPYAGMILLITTPLGGAIYGLIESTFGFFVFSGILYASAKLFHGTGTFLTQSWLLALVYIPLGLVIVLTDRIPVAGTITGIVASLYEIVLTVLAIISAHHVQRDTGIAIVLVPIIAVAAVACILSAIVGLVLATFQTSGY